MTFKFNPDAKYQKALRLLTIRQPWAWATIYAGRDVECRPWRTPYRGPVYIVAHRRMTHEDYEAFVAFASKLIGPSTIPSPDALLRGGIIGRATLIDCTSKARSKWFTGPCGLYLADPEPVPFRKCKGSRGLVTSDQFAGVVCN
jgi:hypothetical protein